MHSTLSENEKSVSLTNQLKLSWKENKCQALGYGLNFPPFMTLILAYLNDGTIMALSTDRRDMQHVPASSSTHI
jgi:hypothetical protein